MSAMEIIAVMLLAIAVPYAIGISVWAWRLHKRNRLHHQ